MLQNTKTLIRIALMTGLTCMSAFIRIPFIPVPITLQTLFVYLSGTLLGPWQGSISQILYLLIGLSGLPVFAGGGGPAYVLHPSFGYLLGFPIAAWVSGRLTQRTNNRRYAYAKILLNLSAGMSLILVLGLLGLALNMKWVADKPQNIRHLIWAGGLIFIPGEAIKIILAGKLIQRFRPLMEQKNP